MFRKTALELHTAFMSGEVSAEQITQAFLKRIDTIDPHVRSFLVVFHDRALEKARLLDHKRATGQKLGRLAGVPVSIKDNIHIRGELTTCASKFLENYRAPFSSTVVDLIEQEDGIILGKTNLDEFAMGGSTEHSAFTKTYNPWDLSRTPGGSSGGSAAAVAARLTPLSLGSDTGGSIRQPASFTGTVGFKPTYGRVSRYGLVAFASSLDQIGPFSLTVADAAYLMEIIGRHCPNDATSIPAPKEHYLDQLKLSLQGKTIGVPFAFLENLHPESKELFDRSLEIYRSLGVNFVEVDLDLVRHSIPIYYIIATAEASTNLARFDGVRYGKRSTHAKTIEQLYDLSKEEGFGPEVKQRILLGTYVLTSGFQDAYYKKAMKVRTKIMQQFSVAFENCDIIAMPVAPQEAFQIGAIKDPLEMYLQDLYTISANLAGLPAISVPCGFTKTSGMPFGLQLIGRQLEDGKVLQFAHHLETQLNISGILPKGIAQFEGA